MSQWVKIRSLHLTSLTSRDGQTKTLCGRWAPVGAPQYDVRPVGKTCETCLRIQVGR